MQGMLNWYGLILVAAAFINAISQVILKKSAEETKDKKFSQKLMNKKVLLAYAIFIAVIFINLYAFRGVGYKYGGAINAIGQVFVLILSVWICREQLTKNRIIGNIFIIVGVILYSFQ